MKVALKLATSPKDIRGFSVPAKPCVRCTPEGYKAKVWYQNGSGMLWMWTFFFTDPMPSVEAALAEAKRQVLEHCMKARQWSELEAAEMRAMGKSLMSLND